MHDADDDKAKQWNTVDKMIARWLQERQELILLLCAVNGLSEFTPRNTPLTVKLQAFCQVLMDYLSAGHFEMYEKLLREATVFGDNGEDILNKLYPRIQDSTDLAIQFNDRYDNADNCDEHPESLAQDMSKLAEALEERFQIEDHLIEVLHSRHKDLVA